MRRLLFAALGVVFLIIFAVPSSATGPVLVSRGDPYAACSIAHQTGTNYPDAEVEPSVTAAAPSTVVGAWQQDRWSNGGARGLVAGFSSDGGATWGQSPLPFAGCASGSVNDPFTGSPFDRASDVWVSAGPDRAIYAVALEATVSNGSIPGNNDTAVTAATSTDGGHTWGSAKLIKADQGTSPIFEVTHFFNDKESVTADPTHSGTAYVVWDRLASPSASIPATLRARAFRGPTWFSKTTDGGKTWSTARPIFDPGEKSQTLGNIVVVNPKSGALYDFFERFQSTGNPNAAPRGASIGYVKSTDGGATWSDAVTVSAQDVANDVDPNTGALLRTGAGLPAVAIDPSTGQFYVVWEDARFTPGTNKVVLSTSTDGGVSWSTPQLVSATTPVNRAAFTPEVVVNSSGTVGVSYYDQRDLAAGNTTTLPTILLAKTSRDHGATFGPDIPLAGPFNDLVAPRTGSGIMLGDYSGLTNAAAAFAPFFAQTNCTDSSCTANPTDIFAASF